MIQNNIRRAEELKKITSSVIKLRAELENVNQALQKLINKEIQEIEEEDRFGS
jgi:K+/H+ antiporter YhaU regulatory subunit KhtT